MRALIILACVALTGCAAAVPAVIGGLTAASVVVAPALPAIEVTGVAVGVAANAPGAIKTVKGVLRHARH